MYNTQDIRFSSCALVVGYAYVLRYLLSVVDSGRCDGACSTIRRQGSGRPRSARTARSSVDSVHELILSHESAT